MVDRTLRDREVIPPALKTVPSSSLGVGVCVKCVFVPGNDTTAWSDDQRQLQWQKAREGVLYPGVVVAINHGKHLVNVDFDDSSHDLLSKRCARPETFANKIHDTMREDKLFIMNR